MDTDDIIGLAVFLGLVLIPRGVQGHQRGDRRPDWSCGSGDAPAASGVRQGV